MPLLPEKTKSRELLAGPRDTSFEYLLSQRQFFHKMQKEFQQVRRFFANPNMVKDARSPYKTYEGARLFPMKPQVLAHLGSIPFVDVLANRTTFRKFAETALERIELDTLLTLAAGERTFHGLPASLEKTPKRFVLSAGGLYPLEIYFINYRVAGLPPGLFHFHPGKNALELVRDEVLEVSKLYRDEVLLEQTHKISGVILVTAMVERNRIKYGDRAARFIYLDTGHLSQNLGLGAAALQLVYWPQGATDEAELVDYLGIDGVSEVLVHSAVVGRAAGDRIVLQAKISFVNQVKRLFRKRIFNN